jgi:hypothetical protein
MVREPATNDCKPQGTHKTLGLVSRIYELKLMEGDPTERRELRNLSSFNMRYKARSFMIWRKLDEEHVHEPMTLCIFCMCQVQVVHEKDPLNNIQ